jgi:hypothetical protein
MKQVFKNILVVVIITFITTISCTKLDEKVYDKIIAEQFVPQPTDIWRIIGAAYTPLPWPVYMGWGSYFDQQEECTDILVVSARHNPKGGLDWQDGGRYKQTHQHNWSDAGPGEASAAWTNIYKEGVFKTNFAIFSVDSVLPIAADKTPEIQRAVKDSLIAELRVVRAFYYWMLCDVYGNVPIVTDYKDQSLPLQKTRAEVFNFIVNEIRESSALLSTTAGGNYYGRFNKYAAQALLAKIYLNAEVYINESRYDSCRIYCDSIIDAHKYELDADYKTPFSTNNNADSKELIFALCQGNDYGVRKQGWFYLMFKSLHEQNKKTYNFGGDGPWGAGGFSAIPQFINTYSANDKRLAISWIKGQQYSLSGDSLFCTQDNANVKKHKPLNFSNTLASIDLAGEDEGYRTGKYEIAIGTNEQLANDFPIFRYAEILMMKAECLLRSGDADGAATLVTQVRKRCFDNPDDAVVTGDTLLKGSRYNYGLVDDGVLPPAGGGADIQYGRFLDELGWEFAIEAHRRIDMIRFGVFTSKAYFNHAAEADNHTCIFPISATTLKDNPNLKQNPGY